MKQAFARLCLTLNSLKNPWIFMTELCWVPGPFVLNIHAVSTAFHWTCLGCQSLAFGQCGTIWKAWVNSWPHGNQKNCVKRFNVRTRCSRFPFQQICAWLQTVCEFHIQTKKYIPRPPMIWLFFSLSSTNALCFPICSNAHGFQATISQVWVVLSNQTYPPCRRHVHKRGFADRSVPDELKTFTQ